MDYCASAAARVPGWAMGLSLAAHAALFTALPGLQTQHPAATAPLLASLRLAPPAVRPSAEAAPAHIPLRRERAPAGPAPARLAAAQPVEVAIAETFDRRTLTLGPSASEGEGPGVRVLPEERTGLPEPLATVPAGAQMEAAPQRPDAADLASYARLLAELLARQRQYPRLAALRGWEGEVQLRVQVARKGAIVAVQVLRSSGFEVLDRHALQMVQQAAPLPPLPEPLLEREFHIVVPVHYKLEKAT